MVLLCSMNYIWVQNLRIFVVSLECKISLTACLVIMLLSNLFYFYCVFGSMFAFFSFLFLFFFFLLHAFRRRQNLLFTYCLTLFTHCSDTIYALFMRPTITLLKKKLKISPTILFIHIKIIYFVTVVFNFQLQ